MSHYIVKYRIHKIHVLHVPISTAHAFQHPNIPYLNTKYEENRTTIYYFYVDFLFRKKMVSNKVLARLL